MSLSDRNLRAPLEQAAEVRREGFTVQPRALAARQVARCRAACPAAHDCCLAGFGVQHSPGHYDVLVPGFAGPRFGFLHAGAPWMGTARALLGDGCALLAAGVLDSDPGAAAGEARHGSAHLLEEPLAGAAASPPHCIAVLIPLVDLGGETNGTAVWPRSPWRWLEPARGRWYGRLSARRPGLSFPRRVTTAPRHRRGPRHRCSRRRLRRRRAAHLHGRRRHAPRPGHLACPARRRRWSNYPAHRRTTALLTTARLTTALLTTALLTTALLTTALLTTARLTTARLA